MHVTELIKETNSDLGESASKGLLLVLQTKIWEREHLPLNNSLIPLEMLLFLAICRAEGKRLTVKGLTNSSAFSVLGAAIHMRRLQREGYITLEQDNTDRRVKYILTTPKLDVLLIAYIKVLRDCLGQLQAVELESLKSLPVEAT